MCRSRSSNEARFSNANIVLSNCAMLSRSRRNTSSRLEMCRNTWLSRLTAWAKRAYRPFFRLGIDRTFSDWFSGSTWRVNNGFQPNPHSHINVEGGKRTMSPTPWSQASSSTGSMEFALGSGLQRWRPRKLMFIELGCSVIFSREGGFTESHAILTGPG